MKKLFLISCLACGTLFSCSKEQDYLGSGLRNSQKPVNSPNVELGLRTRLIELQAQGYFLFMSDTHLEQRENHLRATATLSSSLLNFFEQKDVVNIFEQAKASDIAELLETTEPYKKLDLKDKALVKEILTNPHVIMCLEDFNRLLRDNKTELRSLTYGQFYTIKGVDKNAKKFIAKAAIAAGMAVAAGSGPVGIGAAFLGSMLMDLVSLSSATIPSSTTGAYLEVPSENTTATAVATP